MSRGRPRHQASRRRTYSSRQRELRERHVQPIGWETARQTDQASSADFDDAPDFDAAPAWPMRLSGRASAA
jgi:hypothetical protein